MTLDQINGLFELLGALLLTMNVWRTAQDGEIKGVSLVPTTFFATWGWWNLVFYPSVNAWYSFWGGLVMVTVNSIWLCQMGLITWRKRR